MADAAAVERLAKGVPEWNAWRRARPDVIPDLREADLRDAPLADADLSSAQLLGANLRGAGLRSADLHHANLCEAKLIGANLTGADLRGACLTRAQLVGANLRDANLEQANLADANLVGAVLRDARLVGASLLGASLLRANFDRAVLGYTAIARADLRGLVQASALHWEGPLHMDWDSIESAAALAELGPFLARAGLPVAMRGALATVLGQRADLGERPATRVCVRHAAQDEALARRIRDALQDAGFTAHRVLCDLRWTPALGKPVFGGLAPAHELVLCSERWLERPSTAGEIDALLALELQLGARALLIPIATDEFVREYWEPVRTELRQALLERLIEEFGLPELAELDFQRGIDRLLRVLRPD